MKTLTLSAIFLTATTLAVFKANATPTAFSCDFRDKNLTFATDIEKGAVDVRRVYVYDDNTKYYVYIHNMNEPNMSAEITTEKDGRVTKDYALCTYVLGD